MTRKALIWCCATHKKTLHVFVIGTIREILTDIRLSVCVVTCVHAERLAAVNRLVIAIFGASATGVGNNGKPVLIVHVLFRLSS